MTKPPAERIRTLLLRGDNVLKTQGRVDDHSARVARARAAFLEAHEVARDPAVDARLRELIDRRLAALEDDGAAGE